MTYNVFGGTLSLAQSIKANTGFTADNLWNIASDHDAWRALQTVIGQNKPSSVKWFSECVISKSCKETVQLRVY